MKNLLKPLFSVALLALTIGFANVNSASAQVTFSGNTTGTLTNSPGLTFAGSSFSGTTSNGFLAFGGGAGNATENFGRFTLTSSPTTITAGTFNLNLTFTAPTGVTPSANFNATVVGNVTNDSTGGAQVTFTNPTQAFAFTGPNGPGTFSLTLNNVAINPGATATITGFIVAQQANPVPEPATMILLGTGLAGIAAKVRRRKNSAQDKDSEV